MGKLLRFRPDPDAARKYVHDVASILSEVYRDAALDAGATFDVSTWAWLDESVWEYAGTRGAELVGMKWTGKPWASELVENPNSKWSIDQTTRERLEDMLIDAEEEGVSTREFAVLMRDSGLFSEERAEMIARTEEAISENRGQIATFRELGFEQVEVMDGDEDDECAEADGSVWSVEEAEANPISHPNCTRTFTPIVNEEQEAA